MARCPAGHESQASDYCDTCGLVIGGESAGAGSSPLAAALASSGPAAGGAAAQSAGGGGAAGSRCPVCEAERNGRFCEECGYDFDLAEAMPQVVVSPGVPPAPPEPQPAFSPVSESEPEREPEPQAEASGAEGRGFDLDAELARAEAEAAAVAAPSSAGTANAPEAPEAREAEGTAESAAQAAVLPGREPSPDPDAPLPVAQPSEASSGLGPVNVGRPGESAQELALVVNADRDYYKAQLERGDIVESEFPFPKYPSERRFTFAAGPVRIGRSSASRGLNPEIDLTGPPLDPAVSHLHAQLLRHSEGWVVVDLGSSNGTRLNDAQEPLEAETEIPVRAGDRVHLGVWTTITIL